MPTKPKKKVKKKTVKGVMDAKQTTAFIKKATGGRY